MAGPSWRRPQNPRKCSQVRVIVILPRTIYFSCFSENQVPRIEPENQVLPELNQKRRQSLRKTVILDYF